MSPKKSKILASYLYHFACHWKQKYRWIYGLMKYYWRIFYYRKHYPSQKQSSQKADLCEAFRILSIKAWQNIGVIFSHTMAYLLYCILDVFIQFYIFPSPALLHIKTQIIQRGSNCVKNVNILWWREETHGSIYSGYWTKQWRWGSRQYILYTPQILGWTGRNISHSLCWIGVQSIT